jgi:predicted ABC-type exoprotein transport system permease subunit
MYKKISKYWLQYSVGLSFLCSIHCIATPIFILFVPFFKNLHEYNTYLEILLLLSVLLLGGSSLIHDFRSHHKKALPVILFLIGFLILVSGHLFFHDHSTHEVASSGLDNSSIVIISGSILLFTGQMIGLYLRNRNNYFSKASL